MLTDVLTSVFTDVLPGVLPAVLSSVLCVKVNDEPSLQSLSWLFESTRASEDKEQRDTKPDVRCI